MKFINYGEPIKIRQGKLGNYYWITLSKNEIIDLPKKVGQRKGLTKLKTTEGQIGDKQVETKQIDHDSYVEGMKDGIQAERDGVTYTPDDLFFKELKKINGIGKKTARDIVTWGTKEKLIEYIQKGANLPFRDDVEEKLKRKYEN